MSFTANLYKFSKDNRSTGIPSGDGTVITGINYKKPTSRETPDFEFTTDSMNDDFEFNYLKIHDKYFYINDVTIGNRDKFVLHCSKDRLATYRTQIHNSNQYIVRSTHTSDLNGYINDTAYAMTSNITTSHTDYFDQSSTGSWISSTFGTAVLGVLGPNQGDTTTYYEMSTGTLTTFIQTLYGVDVGTALGVAEIGMGLLKTLFDPIKYLTSCILLPYNYGGSGTTNIIKAGYLDIPLGTQNNLSKIQSIAQRVFTAEINYGNHPQAGTRGHYLNIEPYTQRKLSVMPFGTFDIDCSKLNDYQHKIRLSAHCNKSDGNATLEVFTIPDGSSGTHNTLFWSNAQLGVHIPLYQSDSIFKQTYSLMGSQVGAVGAVMTGNFASLPGIAGQWCGAINTMHAPNVHMVGGASGSFILNDRSGQDPQLDSTYYNVVPYDNNLGVMVCDMRRLGDMPGFNICQNSKINISGPESDREYIRNIMNTGIIIE